MRYLKLRCIWAEVISQKYQKLAILRVLSAILEQLSHLEPDLVMLRHSKIGFLSLQVELQQVCWFCVTVSAPEISIGKKSFEKKIAEKFELLASHAVQTTWDLTTIALIDQGIRWEKCSEKFCFPSKRKTLPVHLSAAGSSRQWECGKRYIDIIFRKL